MNHHLNSLKKRQEFMNDLYDLPSEKRAKKGAIRYKLVLGEGLFNELLDHLNMTFEEFSKKYGEQLITNQNIVDDILVEMIHKNMTRRFKK